MMTQSRVSNVRSDGVTRVVCRVELDTVFIMFQLEVQCIELFNFNVQL